MQDSKEAIVQLLYISNKISSSFDQGKEVSHGLSGCGQSF